MPNNTDILTAAEIDTFTRKLQATLARAAESTKLHALIESFTASLGGAVTVTKSPAAKAPKAAKAAKKSRRTRKPALATDKVLAAVKAATKDGIAVGEVAAKVGEKDKGRVAVALRTLRDEKKVKLVGEKRAARWFEA